MKINKSFLAFLLSVLLATVAYAIMVQGGADRYDDLGSMPLYIQLSILLYWFAIINAVAWLTMTGISLGRYIDRKMHQR